MANENFEKTEEGINYFVVLLIVLILIALAATMFFYGREEPVANNDPIETTDPTIVGCYAVHSDKDVYTLSILSQRSDGGVEGTLVFNNFEKDSSSGSFKGTYEDGILLGDYSFTSEGTDSVIEVIFKKSGDDFIRGYGELNETGTRFENINDITYDPTSTLAVFEHEECDETAIVQIVFPAGGEILKAGEQYTLEWNHGRDPIHIFLIDQSLESTGASVSIADRVYGLENDGSYLYTIPEDAEPGTYQFQIGDRTSQNFTIINE